MSCSQRIETEDAAAPTAAPITDAEAAITPSRRSKDYGRSNVRQREQGRGKVAYLEGWQIIAEANRSFGFDGWQRQTIAVRCVAQA
jgi:recombination DNA repair RAD52 pathway protein